MAKEWAHRQSARARFVAVTDTIDTNAPLILARPACWTGVDLRTLKQRCRHLRKAAKHVNQTSGNYSSPASGIEAEPSGLPFDRRNLCRLRDHCRCLSCHFRSER